MDNQAYDHDLSVMNNNSARKKELEVGNFDKEALFMTINMLFHIIDSFMEAYPNQKCSILTLFKGVVKVCECVCVWRGVG